MEKKCEEGKFERKTKVHELKLKGIRDGDKHTSTRRNSVAATEYTAHFNFFLIT